PVYWLYFLTISELIIFLSPVQGMSIALLDLGLFIGIVYFEEKGLISRHYSMVGGFDPFQHFPKLVGQSIGSLTLYALGSIFLSVIIFRFKQKSRDLETSNILLEKQSEEVKHLLELSEERRLAIEIKNQELEKNNESIFKLMHHVEEVNKRLRAQGKELENRKDELELLNKKLLIKHEDLLKSTAELERANMELQKLDHMKSEFISTVSHEIRTPLTSIREGVSLINEKALGPLNPQQEKFISIVQNNVLRLSALIHDILDLSKLESGLMEIHKRSVDLELLIESVVESIKQLAVKRRIVITTSFSKDLPFVYADEQRVGQVLTNLIGNAIKFTQEGGMIVVGAYWLAADNKVHISVMDTGRGIPKDEIPEIFNKFYQIGREVGAGSKGTGLGLPICQEIVRLHGGRIWAESELGHGSKFSFTLPRFSVENYVEDLFQDMVLKAEMRGRQVAFILYKIMGFSYLKQDANPKQVDQLFGYFMDLVISKSRTDARVVTDPENGFVLILEISTEENVGKEMFDVESTLANASFFLGDREAPLKFHMAKAIYPRDGASKENLLQFLGIQQEALTQFRI
ncbi:MAG: hypothetical protein HZC17_09665, partial [Candidatus Omnitrophica bacterium]|nr:hypothetical protein [Candidatus Omnitrophota bacterium]